LRGGILASLAILLAGAVAAATPPPRRVGTNRLRAQRMRELVHQALEAPNPDAGEGLGNPDGGDIVDGQEFWWIGATSPAKSLPNTGVEAVMQEVDTPPPVGSGCFDCWTSETLDNGLWGQVGFAACSLGGNSFVSTFYQIWDTNPPEELLVDARVVQSSPGIHTYAMNLESGTTWAYSVDGTTFGVFDMRSAKSSGANAIATLCEEGDGVADPFVPPAISVPVAMALLDEDAGIWAGAPEAEVYNTADLSGAAGNLQDSSLADDVVDIGGTIPLWKAGEKLWSGDSAAFAPDAGPAGANALAPPLVTLTAPRPLATVHGKVTLTGTVTAADAGVGIADVEFFVESQTGVFVQQTPVTGPPFSTSWDTTRVVNGSYFVFLQAIDENQTQTYVDLAVTVDNQPTSGTTGGTSSGTAGGTTGTTGGATSSGSSTGVESSSTTGSAGTGTTTGTASGGTSSGGSSTGAMTPVGSVGIVDRGSGCTTGAGDVMWMAWLLALGVRVRRRQ